MKVLSVNGIKSFCKTVQDLFLEMLQKVHMGKTYKVGSR